MRSICSLSVHDQSISKDDVVLNFALFLPDHAIIAGSPLQLTAVKQLSRPDATLQANDRDGPQKQRQNAENLHEQTMEVTGSMRDNGNEHEHPVDLRRGYYFIAKEMEGDISSRLTGVQISIAWQVAQAFNLKKDDRVLVSEVDEAVCIASHVEIAFRDEYLARADMWHLVTTELAGRTNYKNMKIWSMRTIKAFVKNVYVKGEKVQSAIFTASTKPIFRSESARYILFIQMSKEMWDFDAAGSGEIMFSKAINGFLPELFERWRKLNAKHIITIVLFTRIEYKRPQYARKIDENRNTENIGSQNMADDPYRDFYRVVVSDMASGDSAGILGQLKAEFKVFLRDVCIRHPVPGHYFTLGSSYTAASTSELPEWVISGRPSSASRGNILEAIDLASSQFSMEYVDRDLVRTGVSIAVVTPGTGVFEVDESRLRATTNNLVANGVAIDLVCLSRMPLHSVPLFKYRASDVVNMRATPSGESEDRPYETASGSASSLGSSIAARSAKPQDGGSKSGTEFLGQWSYAVPHWIDVSFWTSASDDVKPEKTMQEKSSSTPSHMWQPRKAFRPRVRIHELQMMGVMEDTMDDISISYLPSTSSSQQLNGGRAVSQKFPLARKASSGDVSKSIASQNNSHSHTLRAPANARNHRSSSINDAYHFMNAYDERIFLHPRMTLKTRKRRASLESQQLTKHISLHGVQGTSLTREVGEHGSLPSGAQAGFRHRGSHGNPMDVPMQSSGKVKQSGFPSTQQRTRLLPKPARFSRQISFGLRGFGATTPKAVASTEVFAEHAKSPSLLRRTLQSQELPSPVESVPQGALQSQDPVVNMFQYAGMTAAELGQSSDSEGHTLSRPISIRKNTAIRVTDVKSADYKESTYTYGPAPAQASHKAIRDPATTSSTTNATHIQEEEAPPRNEEYRDSLDSILDRPRVASENTITTPWLTVLDPCNPLKTDGSMASRLCRGRWQHTFPRPLRASKMKWNSLCSPAAVPITTDDFPTANQLTTGYQQFSYTVAPANDHELSEQARSRDWLIREMTAIRLSHGFQIVTGPAVAQFLQWPADQRLDVFDKNLFTNNDIVVHLSKNNEIHQMKYTKHGEIEITSFSQTEITKQAAKANSPSEVYKSAIRTMLADEYIPREIKLYQNHEGFDWRKLDLFLAETGKQQSASVADSLRSWRARFVLIPIDPPANSRRPLQSLNEDSEEEMRLEGIQRLTRIWQKFRYISPEERRFQVALRRRKDTNPLDIMYQTRNPSAIVAAEKENIGGSGIAGGAVELLPESELLQRSNLNVASLAQTIQSDKGISMVDRRWHWRLHYSCFIGFELTTWLLQNFRDIDTREEAVVFGNELMENGLFQHVEQRHNFRDGNYFYQIAGHYRTPRPESRSWFGARKSVPQTPISEVSERSLLGPLESRLSSSKGETTTNDTQKSTGNTQKLGVALSKSLLYDVDHRKRSYRRELITLHYDRLHNPDNCYHIRIDWMNATSKLIEDAIISWATIVDRYGLKLVEVPLGEASSISSTHPFRAPYLVKLARRPPSQQPQSFAYFDTKSFRPQSSYDDHFYQKTILKKFQYVLDFEAASDFPPDVDVTYSWGVPDYKFAQYVHRSGTLLVQITNEGHFLLLANRLYTNRIAFPHEITQETTDPNFHTYRSNAYRGSPRASPSSSPKVRPTTDSVPQVNSHTAPELLKAEFEAFCQDAAALDAFYDETLRKPLAPRRHAPYAESSIPTLGLPPSFELRNKLAASEITESAKSPVEGVIPSATGADAPEHDSIGQAPDE